MVEKASAGNLKPTWVDGGKRARLAVRARRGRAATICAAPCR